MAQLRAQPHHRSPPGGIDHRRHANDVAHERSGGDHRCHVGVDRRRDRAGHGRGGPGVETTIMGIFMYNQGFRYFELGLGSATAVVLLGISFIIADSVTGFETWAVS